MKCNICGGELKDGATVCKYCGNMLKQTPERTETKPVQAVRTEYNREIDRPYRNTTPSGRKYCIRCGRPLNNAGRCIACDNTHKYSRNTEAYTMAQKKKKKKKQNRGRNIILSIIGLIILFMVAIMLALKLAGVLGIGGFISNTEETPKPQETLPVVRQTWSPEIDSTPKPTDKPTDEPTKKPEKTPVPQEKGDPVELWGGAYEYRSNTHLITREELDALSRETIKHIYWEVYARHGYTFDGELADYFETNHSWYIPTTTDIQSVEASFNDIEKRNIRTIYDYQKEKGWR